MDGWKSSATLYGKRLPLTEQEYDALYTLAKKQGKPIPFEQLYKLRWQPEDGADARAEAHSGMANIAKQVEKAGKGSFKVKYEPGDGYFLIQSEPLKTLWRRQLPRIAAISIGTCAVIAVIVSTAIPGIFKQEPGKPCTYRNR
jgi:hypothetical protein